jgi:hypothetical protein
MEIGVLWKRDRSSVLAWDALVRRDVEVVKRRRER